MTKIFLSTFYALLTFVAYSRGLLFLRRDSLQPDHFALAHLLRLLPNGYGLFPLIFIIALFILLIAVFRHGAIFRISAFLAFALLISMRLSLPGFDYVDHIWVIAAFCMCFFSPGRTLKSSRNFLIVRLIQAFLLANYFTAGLWNLKILVTEGGAKNLTDSLFEQVSHLVMSGSGPGYFVEHLFFGYPKLSQVAFFAVIAFEIVSIVPIYKTQLLRAWAVLAIVFQVSAMAVMGDSFLNSVLAIAFFAILTPVYWDQEPLSFFKPEGF